MLYCVYVYCISSTVGVLVYVDATRHAHSLYYTMLYYNVQYCDRTSTATRHRLTHAARHHKVRLNHSYVCCIYSVYVDVMIIIQLCSAAWLSWGRWPQSYLGC